MGAVGINFGSATSGAGFDVTTTVASIVSNLQSVETPWKTQLTSLKADDTALTSIGSDLASFSTSISALTDFQGVMASKAGSSSDTGVLTLSAASPTAVAGSHTVVVSQLAQTSSDNSSVVPSRDILSGGLTLQVGTGIAHSIPVVSGTSDTLATYAAAINSADIGVIARVITDTTGSRLSLLSGTSGLAGQLTVTSNGGTVAATTAVTTAATSVAPTTTVAATNTFTLAAATDQLSGTFSYAIGGGSAATVNLGSTPLSLADTAAALNLDSGFSGANLVASVNGANLVITGATDSTGTASIDTTGSSLTTTTPAFTVGALTDTTSPIATSVASTATIAASNTFSFPSSTSVLTGTFKYAIGGGTAATVNLGSTPLSLAGAVAALNADSGFSGAGLQASVGTGSNANQLIVTGTTGTSGSASIDTTGSSLATPLAIQTGLLGQDAQLKVDGISIDSASNTVSTAIPGVTFQLLSAAPTTNVQIEIVNNNSGVEAAFSTFVSAYNTVMKDLTTQEGNDSTGAAEPLYGNSIISKLQSSLSLALTAGTASGSISNLYNLGITVNNDGTLKLDSATLDSVLNSNYSDVVGFMQNSGSFGQSVSTTLGNLGNSNPMGAISLVIAQDASQEATLNSDVTAQDALISAQKASLTTELNLANEVLQSIPQQLDEMNQLYSAMTGYNTGSH